MDGDAGVLPRRVERSLTHALPPVCSNGDCAAVANMRQWPLLCVMIEVGNYAYQWRHGGVPIQGSV